MAPSTAEPQSFPVTVLYSFPRLPYRKKSMIITFKLTVDTSGCQHSLTAGPTSVINNMLFGRCFNCDREIALELGESGKVTGKSWLVESHV